MNREISINACRIIWGLIICVAFSTPVGYAVYEIAGLPEPKGSIPRVVLMIGCGALTWIAATIIAILCLYLGFALPIEIVGSVNRRYKR